MNPSYRELRSAGALALVLALMPVALHAETAPTVAAAAEPVEPAASELAAADRPVVLEAVTVVGQPERAASLPGSVGIIDAQALQDAHVFTTNEALRKIPGVNVRDEEGLGLRPNIGIRGLNPTRSTKVLLLEDGLPLAYAPYGDNASYYHPPVDRFDRIEVLKGAAMNLYGPQTLGGVINYITPIPPQAPTAGVALAAGSRDYFNGHAYFGGRGLLLDYVRKQGEGARDNNESEVDDLNLKALVDLAPGHQLIVRANRYTEDSQVTYSGLTDAEYAAFGREYNPFANDGFDAERNGASLSHQWTIDERASLTTHVYWSSFSRDWWRQSSSTTDGQCGAAFTQARRDGQAVDPNSCASVQGRLRDYYSYGVEPRYQLAHGLFGFDNELRAGLRLHVEDQDRLQVNGATPTARSGTTVESNKRGAEAYSAFVQNRFRAGRLDVTPSLRLEKVNYERENRLNDARGDADLTELLPALGLAWRLSERSTLFGGVHRGFAPPRTEDIIAGSGTAVDLESEESTNYELGLRTRPRPGFVLEATAFRNDFSRQIAVGSIAGGSTPLATGETLYQGVELMARADFGRLYDSVHNPFVELAYTALPTAKSETPLRCVVASGTTCAAGDPVPGSAEGRRLPYAPRHLFTGSVGYEHAAGFDVRVEAVYIGEQFSDFANTREAPADGTGQIGRIDDALIFNAAVNLRVPQLQGLRLFVTGKNLADKDYIVDRTRGILTGIPRLVHGGVEYSFF